MFWNDLEVCGEKWAAFRLLACNSLFIDICWVKGFIVRFHQILTWHHPRVKWAVTHACLSPFTPGCVMREADRFLGSFHFPSCQQHSDHSQWLQVVTLPPPLSYPGLGVLWELPLIHKSWLHSVYWSYTRLHSESHICVWCSDVWSLLFSKEWWGKTEGM